MLHSQRAGNQLQSFLFNGGKSGIHVAQARHFLQSGNNLLFAYQTAFQQLRMGLATAQSVILLLVLVILTFVSRKVVGGTDGD